jgi:hypothetical protein
MDTTKVVVLDLRDTPGDQPTELAGGVIVLDHADSLVDHAEVFLSLLGEETVTAVVCVAIGESTTGDTLDGVVLAIPPALRYATVLWVGDRRGIDWTRNGTHPRPVDDNRDALDDLVAALRVPSVFDAVTAVTEDMTGAAISPGIRLVSGAADPAELADARDLAMRTLCDQEQPPSPALGVTLRQLDAAHDAEGTVLSGPLADARTTAVQRLHHVTALTQTLGTWKALFGRRRPTQQLDDQVRWAGRAAENYRRYLRELLDRMDGQLQTEHPPVDKVLELGVPEPRQARPREIADGMRHAIDNRLRDGTSLFVLARELRLAAATSGPQGCATALSEVDKRGPIVLEPPPFPRWPLSLGTLPLIALTCAALAILPGPGWLAGGLAALAWTMAGWLLLARRPGPGREVGFAASAIPAATAYGTAGLLGVLGGAVATRFPATQLPVSLLAGQLTVLGVALLTVATIALSWRRAVHTWRAALQVETVLATLIDLTRLTEDTTAREWQPMRRRRAIAAATGAVAAAVEEIARALDDAGHQLFTTDPPDTRPELAVIRPVPRELSDVIRADLVDLCRGALEPAWPVAETAHRAAPGVYARRLDLLLTEYSGHVQHRGLLTAPPFSRDPAARDAFTARIWSEKSAVAALRIDVDGDMTQLCRSGQLGYLSTATPPALVRFAPRQVRRILEHDATHQRLAGDPGITWSHDGELIGALRLVPLRTESVRQILGGGR